MVTALDIKPYIELAPVPAFSKKQLMNPIFKLSPLIFFFTDPSRKIMLWQMKFHRDFFLAGRGSKIGQ